MHTCAYGVNCCLSVIQHNHSTEQINNLTGFMPFERVQLPQTAHTHIYTHTKTNSIIYAAHIYIATRWLATFSCISKEQIMQSNTAAAPNSMGMPHTLANNS